MGKIRFHHHQAELHFDIFDDTNRQQTNHCVRQIF